MKLNLYYIDPKDNKIKRWLSSGYSDLSPTISEQLAQAAKNGITAWPGPHNKEVYHPCSRIACENTCKKVCDAFP